MASLTEQLAEFQKDVRGPYYLPGSEGYKEVLAEVYNQDLVETAKKPAVIFKPAGTADVSKAVKFAQENKMELSVQGGGHGYYSLAADTFALDLSLMNSVRINPSEKLAYVQGGAKLNDMDREAQHYGLATTAGHYPFTGVGGLTLSGGVGHLARLLGLSVDNLVWMEVVLADGSTVVTDSRRHANLFWALRGGGGNFGVVTWFCFKLHPVSEIVAGPVVHPLSAAGSLLKQLRELTEKAPNDFSLVTAMVGSTAGGGPPAFLMLPIHCGAQSPAAEEQLRPYRALGTPLADMVGPMPYLALQNAFTAAMPPRGYYERSCFVEDLSDELINHIHDAANSIPSPYCTLAVMMMGGKIAEKKSSDTAYFNRRARWWIMMLGGFDGADPSSRAAVIQWTRTLSETVAPFSSGAYLGKLNHEADPDAKPDPTDKLEAFYGSNLPRLRQVKLKYDPNNIFRHCKNIPPAESAEPLPSPGPLGGVRGLAAGVASMGAGVLGAVLRRQGSS